MESLAAMLPLNTLTVSLSGLSTIGKTFVKHYLQRSKVTEKTEARESLLYDEAFSVMRNFFKSASMSTVEEIQSFCNNFIPAPFWVRVIRVVVPLSTRLEAGEALIAGLGDDDIDNIVGGREWWQRTAHRENGLDAEWISMKRDWEGLAAAESKAEHKKKGKSDSANDEDDAEWQAVQEQLRKMKAEAKARARRRRAEGKARQEASFPNEGGDEMDSNAAEVLDEAEAANAQRQTHGGERFDTMPDDYREGEDAYTSDLDDMPVTLAIHGGAYLLGSINTHRYVYWRIARKTGGRVFAVEYRLSPQFPFPCSLHDCLAAYLYLIRPPPGAKHRAVDPSKITICGDSAGGGMALALMCLLRDVGLPLPAGAMLISPWCDLTHSFPSILQNTDTDIPPPYGFAVFKPSTLWPPPPPEFRKRAAESTSLHGLKEAAHRIQQNGTSAPTQKGSASHLPHLSDPIARHKKHALADAIQKVPERNDPPSDNRTGGAGVEGDKAESGEHKAEIADVIRVKVDGKEVELADQIQLYATNAQLIYPFVSPVWQPSLGGLPPLYIMGGDKEVLRDEIIYLAHRAAHPDRYPVRDGILQQNPRRTEQSKHYPPTKVHLQIYDGICHDLPLFSFTTPAKYCFRAMASFAKWATTPPGRTASTVLPDGMELPVERDPLHPDAIGLSARPPQSRAASLMTGHSTPRRSGSVTPNSASASTTSKPRSLPQIRDLEKTIYSSTQPFNRPEYVDNMIRERISITGVVRPMEPESEMSMLHLDKEDLGVIKEAPVKRYLAGKAVLDRHFSRTYKKVQRKREKHLRKSMQEEATRITKRLATMKKQQSPSASGSGTQTPVSPNETVPQNAAQGDVPPRITDSPEPLDSAQRRSARTQSVSLPIGVDGLSGSWSMKGERPPPSSLAGRKDTLEARKLAKVLDEHYSRFTALNIWGNVYDAVNRGPLARKAAEREDSIAVDST
ncbi:hypothetical protein JCM10908_001605 [Rhodotorula pacifica]|uniref:uncharacterized protein n=1 Tax=Rhodotorula pacifica TaxID=1495444 RepID=UPI0031807CD5